MQNLSKSLVFILLLLISLSASPDKRPFNEAFRPQFHFTPEKNWQNDPNGLIWFEGEYHLFYQHNPNDREWGFMNWGHAVSTDLVHWEHLPIAITPDNDSKDKEFCTAWSGCAVVDDKNLTGLQKSDQKTLLIFYTSRQCGQRMAYSTDKGRTWVKYEGNPLIPFDEKDDARDPKVFWYEPDQKYMMVLWRKPEGDTNAQGISFYSSSNLTEWNYESHLPGFYECPDLVELPVDSLTESAWVIFDGDGSYATGEFDGKKFIPSGSKRKSDFGANYYATQTWSNIPGDDGRTIQIAWMRGGNYPGMPFNGQMTFPCELSLGKYPEGLRLVRKPVREIESLQGKVFELENKVVIPGLNKNPLKGIKGDCFHIVGTFDLKSVNSFGFLLRHSREKTGTEVRFDATKNTLSCLGQTASLLPEDGKISLEILVDRTSVEIFGNGGRLVMTSCFNPEPDANELVLYNTGGELGIDQLRVYPLKSMYEKSR